MYNTGGVSKVLAQAAGLLKISDLYVRTFIYEKKLGDKTCR